MGFCLTYEIVLALVNEPLSAGLSALSIGFPVGSILGAGLGVIGVAWALDDEGNESASFVGAAIGFLGSFYVYGSLTNHIGWQLGWYDSPTGPPSWVVPLHFICTEIGAGLGAVAGYHLANQLGQR